jgi:hypothetical protein
MQARPRASFTRQNVDLGIVHMIPFCIQVLEGRVPEQNERRITKAVALILLAHYVADIHQPLHVGAEYFDRQGRVVDPNEDPSALGDEGGNTFTLELNDEPPRRRGIHRKKLHGFWDNDAVNALFLQWPVARGKSEFQALVEPHKRELIYEMATHDPNNWRMPPNVPVVVMPKYGRTKFCQLRARRMRGWISKMCTRNQRKTVSLLPVKQSKNRLRVKRTIVRGQPTLCDKNYTKPVGGLPICCRKFFS